MAVLVLTTVKNLFMAANTMLVERLTQRTAYELRTQVFRRVLDLDVASFHDDGTSGLMSRITHDVQALSTGVRVLWSRGLGEPLKMAACLVGASLICWRLLALTLFLAPLAAYLVRRLSGSLKRANRRAMEGMQELMAVLSESFGGIEVVKAYTMER